MNDTSQKWRIKHIPLKRIFDILFSLGALILSSPLFLLFAILIKTQSEGPIFFSQLRVGRGGRIFRCYKFRTMYPDAETRLDELLSNDLDLQKEWMETHKLKVDPRVTPVGAFLRRTSLDELPQFWNVLKGDLSVVGPRPVVEEEIRRHFGELAKEIFSIRPGLTGLWQVSGRSDTSYSNRIQLDREYVNTRNFLLDLKLIALTIPGMIFKRGAY